MTDILKIKDEQGNWQNISAITGPQGPKGDTGNTGPQGPAGVGVPTGGTTGQVLAKRSGTNYDTQWVNQSGGGGVPEGGTAGQIIVKQSSQEGDAEWTDDLKNKVQVTEPGVSFSSGDFPNTGSLTEGYLTVATNSALSQLSPIEKISLGKYGGGTVFDMPFLQAFGAQVIAHSSTEDEIPIAAIWMIHPPKEAGAEVEPEGDCAFMMCVMGQKYTELGAFMQVSVYGYNCSGTQPNMYIRTMFAVCAEPSPGFYTVQIMEDESQNFPAFPLKNSVGLYSSYLPMYAAARNGLDVIDDPELRDFFDNMFFLSTPGSTPVRMDTAAKIKDWAVDTVQEEYLNDVVFADEGEAVPSIPWVTANDIMLETLVEKVGNDGNYCLKFADGNMVAVITQTFSVTFAAWNNIYESETVLPPNFAVPFISTPACTVSLTACGLECWVMLGSGRSSVSGAQASATRAQGVCLGRDGSGNTSVTLSWIAIGRWK